MRRTLKSIFWYLLNYAFGVLGGITFASSAISGYAILIAIVFIVFFSWVGFPLFYFSLPPQYTFGNGNVDLGLKIIGLISVGFGLMTFTSPLEKYRRARPFFIGFPIGFIGALGMIFTIASSI